MSDDVLACSGLAKTYGMGNVAVPVLKGIDLVVRSGESLAIVGASGSGKSTLLHLLGGLDRPTAGSVKLLGEDLFALDPRAQGLLRNRALGFVYQFHHLLPEFSAAENLILPQMIRGLSRAEAAKRASELLSYLGLGARERHRPAELSGGEQQRVAIARAVANGPRVLLADEPTGNLDPKTADHVFSTLAALVQASGLAALIATHNLELAARMDRRVTLQEGRIIELS
jgi:lipoprotein-releasing system ATP-binding protein